MSSDRAPLMLKPVGVHYKSRGFPKEKVQYHYEQVSKAASLRDLSEEYTFYTPALMYMRVRLMGRDPYYDFQQESGINVMPVSLKFSSAIFRGLDLYGDYSWNHVLLGMPNEHWQDFSKWMGTVAYLDRDLGVLTRIRLQTIEIADPLKLARLAVLPARLPMVPVTVLALDTNKGSWYIHTPPNPLSALPTLATMSRKYKDTKVFANALLNDSPDPYREVTEAYGGVEKVAIQELDRKLKASKDPSNDEMTDESNL